MTKFAGLIIKIRKINGTETINPERHEGLFTGRDGRKELYF